MSLVRAAKLNGRDPWAYLRSVLACIHSHTCHRLTNCCRIIGAGHGKMRPMTGTGHVRALASVSFVAIQSRTAQCREQKLAPHFAQVGVLISSA
nr:transposase domain-containing protein [Variovorax sp. PDC80]